MDFWQSPYLALYRLLNGTYTDCCINKTLERENRISNAKIMETMPIFLLYPWVLCYIISLIAMYRGLFSMAIQYLIITNGGPALNLATAITIGFVSNTFDSVLLAGGMQNSIQ